MKKLLPIIPVILIAIFIIIGIYRDVWRENNKNELTFSPNIEVVNNSKIPYVDTLTLAVMDKILGYKEISILIADITMSPNDLEFDVIGYVVKDNFVDHKYILFINQEVANANWLEFISHESVHIDQMETGRLFILPDSVGWVFDNDTIYPRSTSYEDRKFEREAIIRSSDIENQLNDLIYKDFIW